MYYIKPRFTPTTVVEPSSDPSASAFSAVSSAPSTSKPRDTDISGTVPAVTRRSTHLDLFIVRTCLVIEFVPYVVIACNPTSPLFVLMSFILTFASGEGPAMNSLALGLASSKEKGRLFGGIAVLHSIGASLISPLMFGTLFAETVGWYAPTVFALAAGLSLSAQFVLAFVRLPKEGGEGRVERGRSRGVKRVKSSAAVLQ